MASSPPTPLPPHVHPLVGDDPAEVGGHRLIGRLGDDDVGTVHAAVSPGGDPVALKVAHARWAEAAGADREVALLRGGRGVCLVGAEDGGSLHGRPWSATPYVPGPDLARHVHGTGPLAGAVLLVLAAGTAEALASVHAAGVPHGDVRPGNVIVTPGGPRLVDHGIARLLDDGDAPTTAGGPGWLAPERYAGERPGPASDVFSWACLVAFAATGRPPFGQGALLPEMARRAREEPVDLSAVPGELRDLLGRALSPDPARRPPAEEAYLECLLLAGVEDDATREVWADRLRGLVHAHWPHVGTGRHSPEEWLAAGRALSGQGPEATRGRTRRRRGGAGEDPGGLGPGGTGPGTGARRGRGRRPGRIIALAAAASVFAAVALGGGYLLMEALAEDTGTTAAEDAEGPGPEPQEEPPPLSGADLVSASLDTFLAAEAFELTVLTHAGNGEGYGQPPPTDTAAVPTLFDRVLHRSGPPDALRWSSTVSGARTSDLMMVDGDLLRGEGTAWGGAATWYEAGPDHPAKAAVFSPEEVVGPLVRAVESGTVTGEADTVFRAPGPAEDAYGHLAGGVPEEVPAVRVEGDFRTSDADAREATRFVLVATEDGVPLSFATEGASDGGRFLNGRPVSQEAPPSFLAPAVPVERWYTQYTFVELNGEPDLQVPDPADVRPPEPEAPSPVSY
ncbi:serine/threonine protein kinase [Nocardiopsis sp. NPDC058631]|uniref:serine/threonine protein kinase n=1 Tax=Nocardiopsis sp. NPDC058631 TaxID=3346566 RepID=UPI00364BA891